MSSDLSTEIKRINKWKDGEIAPPTKVDIFPTKKCNLNCKFCEFPNTDPEEFKYELNSDKLIEIVNQAGDLGADTFGVIGGEPFVKPDMIEIMEEIKENSMNGSITTNATLLNEQKVKRIVEMKWDLLRISIDGIEKTHDELRGRKGTFSRVIKNLNLFKNLKTNYPTIELNIVLNRENYKEIAEIIELAHHYNIQRVFLLPVIEFNQKASEIKLKGDREVEKYLRKAEKLCKRYNIKNNINEVIEDELYSKSNQTDELIEDHTIPCFVPWYSISINAKGIATPCSQFEEKFGVDVRDNSLEEVWTSSEFKKLRERIAKKDLPETCSKCCAPLLEENKEIRKEIKDQEKLAERYKK